MLVLGYVLVLGVPALKLGSRDDESIFSNNNSMLDAILIP